ncbi:MAG: T9SS type A sorting domain-containing protein [Chitinophagaceae bacterium]|nr:MAG: T9SS type A sorting domain-containing protein [Chitinophagaceae bacterium]
MKRVTFTLCFVFVSMFLCAQSLGFPVAITSVPCPGGAFAPKVRVTGQNYSTARYLGVQISSSSDFSTGTTILGSTSPTSYTGTTGGGVTANCTIPAGLAAGTYWIRAVAINTNPNAVPQVTDAAAATTVVVGPPSMTSPATQTFCAGTASVSFAGTNATSFTWTNNNTAIGLTASGSGNLAFTATNTATAPISGTIAVTPWTGAAGTGCSGTPQSFSVVVNPKPTVNAVTGQTLCPGSSSAGVSFTGNVTGTTYAWTNSNTAIGLAASGSGDIPSFIAANATAAIATATIGVTPTYTNNSVACSGTAGSFTITVNPKAWKGTSSTDWNTAANWYCGVPGASDNIIIASGSTFAPTLAANTSGSVNNLTIGSGVTLTVNGTLNIAGTLSNAGTLSCSGSSSVNAPAASLSFSAPAQLPAITAQSLSLGGAGLYTTGGSITVSTLSLLNTARLNLGANNLTFGSVSNASSSAYIIAEGSGQLRHTGSATFPVGTSAGYSPVTITNGTSYEWGVSMTTGFTGSLSATGGATALQRIWKITPYTGGVAQTAASGTTLSFQFPTSDTTGTRMNLANGGSARAYHWDGSGNGWNYGWQFVGNGGVAQNAATTTVSGVSAAAFSPFAITGPANVLPVSLLSFNGIRRGNRNILNWTTVTEQNNRGFEIQRSADGRSYTAIGFVNSLAEAGQSNSELRYSFEDNATSGSAFYRLRQVDIDNRSSYSKIVKLSARSGAENELGGLYPNPAAAQVTALVDAAAKGTVQLTVLDPLGRPVLSRSFGVGKGANPVTLGIGSLPRGSYLLQVAFADKAVHTLSFVKQ